MYLTSQQVNTIFEKLKVQRRAGGAESTFYGYVEIDRMRLLPIKHDFDGEVISDFAAHALRRSLRLNVEEFGRLRDCPMSRDEYLELLLGRIPSDIHG